MWKKEGVPEPMVPAPAMPAPQAPPAARAERIPSATVPGERATIGRSITIRGEVTGDEDLLIQGRVDGSVDLKQHSVTIGRDGQVKADIIGHVVTVEGSVEGNLTAAEQVILRSSARVHGDITAPRVVLEDGARFRGGVDMGEAPPSARAATRETAQAPAPARDTVEVATAAGAASSDPNRPRDKAKPETHAPAGVAR